MNDSRYSLDENLDGGFKPANGQGVKSFPLLQQACYQADQEPLITFIDGEEHDRIDHRSAASREIEEA